MHHFSKVEADGGLFQLHPKQTKLGQGTLGFLSPSRTQPTTIRVGHQPTVGIIAWGTAPVAAFFNSA
jgi:hypothetical protein